MLKLYTHLYAWAYLRNERQWGKGHNHAFAALINVTMLVFLNLGATVAILSKIFHFHMGSLLRLNRMNVHLAIGVGIPLLVWAAIQRNGRGQRLAEELREKSDSERTRMEWKLIGFLVASFVLFVLSLLLGI